MSDQDLHDDDEAFAEEDGEMPLVRFLYDNSVNELEEEVKGVALVIGEALSGESPGIERFMHATEVMSHEEIQSTLKHCQLFKLLSNRVLNSILPNIQAVKAQPGARLIGKSVLNRGLYIAKKETQIRVIPSDTDDYFDEVGEEIIFKGAHFGEFLFTGTGIKGSANIINLSDDSLFLFIPQEVYASFHNRVKEDILLQILKRSPLPNLIYEDSDSYPVFEKRNHIPRGLEGIPLQKYDESQLRLHYKEKYSKGMGIEPIDTGYLGLITSGTVEVFTNGEEFKKIAEIQAGHTIFESNAAEVENTNVDIFSSSDETEVHWFYLGKEDPKYLDLLQAAAHGIYTKLEAANKMRALALKRRSTD